jgi:hypothetical protein
MSFQQWFSKSSAIVASLRHNRIEAYPGVIRDTIWTLSFDDDLGRKPVSNFRGHALACGFDAAPGQMPCLS